MAGLASLATPYRAQALRSIKSSTALRTTLLQYRSRKDLTHARFSYR